MNIKETLKLLNIQEITTSRQKKNGTREFKLPINRTSHPTWPVDFI